MRNHTPDSGDRIKTHMHQRLPFGLHSFSLYSRNDRKLGPKPKCDRWSATHDPLQYSKQGDEDEPILQNAVYKSIGEDNKVVYVFEYDREQGHSVPRQGVDTPQKVRVCGPVPDDGRSRDRLAGRFYGRSAQKTESHLSARRSVGTTHKMRA